MSNSTPLMQQYDRLKAQQRDAILFFRLGDFYEMFRNDAKEASNILGLTLTARNAIPMCGIPYHAAQSYIPKLLDAGRKVAICEQIRIPEKGIADREIVEVITPGTVVDEACLKQNDHNFIASICSRRGKKEAMSISFIDVSTGDLIITETSGQGAKESLRRDLQRYQPRELLLQESLFETYPWINAEVSQLSATINRFPDWHYEGQTAWELLCEIMKVRNLKAYGFEKESAQLDSVKLLLQYVETNTGKQIRHIHSLKVMRENEYVIIDSSSQKNLELINNLNDGSKQMTLLSAIDQTMTSMGKRLLKQWLLHPLVKVEEITARQQWVGALYHNQLLLSKCREILGSTQDVHRLSARVSMGKAHPKDLLAICRSVEGYIRLYELLAAAEVDLLHIADISQLEYLARHLAKALSDNPPVTITEGGIIREGFDSEIDRLRAIEVGGKNMLQDYLTQESEQSGIHNLRIKHNNVVGYFLEVSKGQLKKIPPHFERRQSLVNADRFTTSRLKELAVEISSAREQLIEAEKAAFIMLVEKLADSLPLLFSAGDKLAQLDCLQSLSHQATLHAYSCPELVEYPLIDITAGWHPVVATVLEQGSFVPNDLVLSPHCSFVLITGPNMAGKSTFLRQNALIILLAHIGSFVPAEAARIGLVDRIFCRVGASDNLVRGESTFLVEMNEAAHILRNASARSLVIMDEVGRGTSTQDGLAIAQAILEYIAHRINCQTLFATHFHELSQLEGNDIKNMSLQVKETDGDIIFLNKVIDGPSTNSYGLHVARIAGIPDEVVFRAAEILATMAGSSPIKIAPRGTSMPSPSIQARHSQKSLFAQDELVIQKLQSLNIDALTPVDALNYLHEMQKMLED